jgi:hypothetical protein
MARGRPYRFAHFGQGFNNADGPYSLREGYADDPGQKGAEARALLNVVSRHRGNISQRDGCISLFDLGGVKATEFFKDISAIGNDSSSFLVLSSTAGKLYAVSSALAVSAALTIGLSVTAPWTFLRMPVIGGTQGPAFGMNGADTPRETDGTVGGTGTWTATSGALPNGTLMAYHENTLWVAGVPATTYSLFWSAVGDPTAWPAANVTKFNPDDGLPLTALASQGPYLLVFKERGIWRVYDSQTSANVKFADNAGTLSPRSVVPTEMGCFFLDPSRGVMLTDGQTTKRVSEQIQPYLNQIAAADLPSVTAAFVRRHYYLTVKVNGVRRTLDYDTELDSWWVHSPTMAAVALWDRGADPEPIGINATVGECWQLFKDGQRGDLAAPYESYWSGPYHAFGAPHLGKRCNRVSFDGRGAVDIYASTDFDDTTGGFEGHLNPTQDGSLFAGAGNFGGVGNFAGGVAVGQQELYSLGVARSWSLTFYSSSLSYWEIDAYTMLMTPRKG